MDAWLQRLTFEPWAERDFRLGVPSLRSATGAPSRKLPGFGSAGGRTEAESGMGPLTGSHGDRNFRRPFRQGTFEVARQV